jgi:hypothetical protein
MPKAAKKKAAKPTRKVAAKATPKPTKPRRRAMANQSPQTSPQVPITTPTAVPAEPGQTIPEQLPDQYPNGANQQTNPAYPSPPEGNPGISAPEADPTPKTAKDRLEALEKAFGDLKQKLREHGIHV